MRTLWKKLVRRLRIWLRPESVEREMDREMRFHLEREVEELLRSGMDADEARRKAMKDFGGVERFKEEGRDAYGGRATADMARDLRHALRSLRTSPGFAGAAILTLALGLGGFLTIYGVVDRVLLEPLPFSEPGRLVRIWSSNPVQGRERYFVSPSDLADWREKSRSFEGLAGYWPHQMTLARDEGDPMRVRASLTTSNYFSLLGLQPRLGRAFVPPDGEPGAPTVAVLSHAAWQRYFGGDPAVVGTTIRLDESPVQVVGVLRPGLVYPADLEVWTNINFALALPPGNSGRAPRWMSVVGRLAPGATISGAHRDLGAIARETAEAFPASNRDWGVALESLPEELLGNVSRKLWLLLGATGLILLIACTNVANLALSRGEGRRHELALRSVLGAGRIRLAKQLLTESLLLAALGGALGLGLAAGAMSLLRHAGPENVPRLEAVGVEGSLVLVSLGLVLVSALLFGLAPALQIAGKDLSASLGDGGRRSGGPEASRLRRGFVVTQIAMAAALLVGAGLLVKSFSHLVAQDPGFQPGGVLTFQLTLTSERYQSLDEVTAFYDELLGRARELPGVTGASMTSSLPLGEQVDYQVPFGIVGREAFQEGERNQVYHRQVGPDFFSVMGVSVLEGRELNDADRLDAEPVVVVNEAMARLYWPDKDPLDERVRVFSGNYGPLGSVLIDEARVVGVVEDIRYDDLRQPAEPSLYFSHRQAPFRQMTVVFRTEGDPVGLTARARSLVAAMDPTLPVSRVQTLRDVVDTSVATDRFTMLLLTAFAGLALLLAAVGTYGVLAYGVARRAPEMGIRMALGAGRGSVVALVMKEAWRQLLAGLILGLGTALALSRLLESQLFGVGGRDPWVFGAVALTLSTVALVASMIPARRAARVDPVEALRRE